MRTNYSNVLGHSINGVDIDDRTVSYLETILWAEMVHLPVEEEELVNDYMNVNEDHPLHGISEDDPLSIHFLIEDFTKDSIRKAHEDVTAFFDWLDEVGLTDRVAELQDDDTVAYDLWLTRNGHGAGFWDGDYDSDDDQLGDILTDKAKEFSCQYVWVGNDGCLHLEEG